MPIFIVNHDGINCPETWCDHCDRRIHEARDGNYQWLMGDDTARAPLYFTHKVCCRAFEAAHPPPPGCLWGANELTVLPLYVEYNLAIHHPTAVAHARLLSY